MGRFRERHGVSATTLPFGVRLAITIVVVTWPAFALLQLVLIDGTVRAWWCFVLMGGTALAVVVLRSVWALSDDAVRDDSRGVRLSRQLERLDEPDEAPPGLHHRTPPRRW
jgi:hypothetical protein